ncbi:MAG: 6,7-dimethyl-8-ribityllumazine synthase [Gammaproteobacteria bacterium]|nr:MAG: 6,7-dimethyl-8-ribityllumazine synthase [Gammaproteobacteria bacterium]
MDQIQAITQDSKIDRDKFALLNSGKRIAFIQSTWHNKIVDQSRKSFINQSTVLGIAENQIDFFRVPGSLEIPLQAKMLAKTGQYAIIVAAGLIVDGGIYRHDFVSSSVLDGLMSLQLELEIPILSLVLTPQHFDQGGTDEKFFFEHFKIKGVEAANACAMTLKNLQPLVLAKQSGCSGTARHHLWPVVDCEPT